MKFTVPTYAVIEASDLQDAQRKAKQIEGLLKNPMVVAVLGSEGITLHQVYSAQPAPTPNVAAVRRG